MIRPILAAAFTLTAAPAFAAGSDDDTAPTPAICEEGLVWDLATETCLPPEQSTNSDNAMMEDIRRLAYEGRFAEASALIELLPDEDAGFALTYQGFIARQTGDWEAAESLYLAALDLNPANNRARSYYGQGLVSLGDYAGARLQLAAIRDNGGARTWPEVSLERAIEGGPLSGY